jgi:hypothetical protein
MKSILFVLLSATLGLVGCEKCYTCVTTVTTTVNQSIPGYPQTGSSSFELCGSQADVDAAEGTVTSSSSQGGIVVTVTSKTNCTQK